MAQAYATVEVFILVDTEGFWVTGDTADVARERYDDAAGSLNESDGFRLVRCKIKVPLPKVAVVELEASAPEFEPPTAA